MWVQFYLAQRAGRMLGSSPWSSRHLEPPYAPRRRRRPRDHPARVQGTLVSYDGLSSQGSYWSIHLLLMQGPADAACPGVMQCASCPA